MANAQKNKDIVARWFTHFWGSRCDLGIVDELAAPDMLLQYSLHAPRRGRADVKAFITKLPVPDPAEKWHYDSGQDCLATDPTQTARIKKVQKPIVLYDATEHHPAQTQLITEDVLVGDWTQIL